MFPHIHGMRPAGVARPRNRAHVKCLQVIRPSFQPGTTGQGEPPMPDAFIYDHVRTPRGRGKADGSLHEVTALELATQALAAVKERNKLDPALVDDVVLGCVDPVGEAGGNIARAAALV